MRDLRPWKPPEAIDAEIREWMTARGWTNRTDYGPRSRVYAWRHEVQGRSSPTLRISRDVLEAYPPFVIVEHLRRLRVADTIRAKPEVRLVVVERGNTVSLEYGAPKAPGRRPSA